MIPGSCDHLHRILRTEGTMDIFASRRWSPDSDDEWEERVI